MTIRVYINPPLIGPDRADGGVRRVIEAMHRYLPEHGVEIASAPDDADLINNHGTLLLTRPGVPMVSSCHGLYWADYDWPAWAHEANRRVCESLIRADACTAPSAWVAYALRRGGLFTPEVVYHGIDPNAWTTDADKLPVVLWNKARVDAISDPRPVNAVASMLPHVRFLSTFGEAAPNVRITGARPHAEMTELISRASVYLCTARETFGIGTLEAMAAGAVVVGYDYGGQREIIRNGETGLLVPPGDVQTLADAIEEAFAHRERLAANARQDVMERWTWPKRIAQYAALFTRVVDAAHVHRPRVSVVVTCHNLARYLPDALNSVYAQSEKDWECVIVDDASTDTTAAIAHEFCIRDARYRYVKTSDRKNVGLSEARNIGVRESHGRYVLPLDADDMLETHAIRRLAEALDTTPGLSVAYGGLDTISEDGGNQQVNPWPPATFDYYAQIAHLNQLPYASMVRRALIERMGGYRPRMWRAEDAEFWCRALSFGGRAQRVTDKSTLIYRIRSDSKGGKERQAHDGQGDPDGDWTQWVGGWAVAHTADAGRLARRTAGVGERPHLIPWAAHGPPPETVRFFAVRHGDFDMALISVVIPVGDGHERRVIDALDSLLAQTYPYWRAIVIDDTTRQQLDTPGAPYAEMVRSGGKRGAGAARNVGLADVRTPLVLFLDADDYLVPHALETMLRAWIAADGTRYIYSDGYHDDGQQITVAQAPDYRQRWWEMGALGSDDQHTITVLMRTDDARAVGFDEQLAGMEDRDFFIRCAINGRCGERVPLPLLVYRQHTGRRRAQSKRAAATLKARYDPYVQGETAMGGCCGTSDVSHLVLAAKGHLDALETERQNTLGISHAHGAHGGASPQPPSMVILRYTGTNRGAISFNGGGGRIYYGADTPIYRYAEVHVDDVDILLKSGAWAVPPTPAPETDVAAAVVAVQVQVTKEFGG